MCRQLQQALEENVVELDGGMIRFKSRSTQIMADYIFEGKDIQRNDL